MGCHPAQERDGIISLAPSLSEAVLAFDNAKLIAVTEYDKDPRLASLPRLRGAGSVEIIAAMRPSLVLLHPSDAQYAEKLQAMGIATLMHSMETLEDIDQTLLDLGERLHRTQDAKRAIEQLHRDMARNAQTYQTQNHAKILLIIDRLDARMQQFYIAQGDAFLVDLVQGCGFEVISPGKSRWERIEAEKLIELDPERILFLTHGREDAKVVKAQFEALYPKLKAVQNHHFLVYDDAGISIPGPEMGKRQTALCKVLSSSASTVGN